MRNLYVLRTTECYESAAYFSPWENVNHQNIVKSTFAQYWTVICCYFQICTHGVLQVFCRALWADVSLAGGCRVCLRVLKLGGDKDCWVIACLKGVLHAFYLHVNVVGWHLVSSCILMQYIWCCKMSQMALYHWISLLDTFVNGLCRVKTKRLNQIFFILKVLDKLARLRSLFGGGLFRQQTSQKIILSL